MLGPGGPTAFPQVYDKQHCNHLCNDYEDRSHLPPGGPCPTGRPRCGAADLLCRMATLDGRAATADDLLPRALTTLGHFTTMRTGSARSPMGRPGRRGPPRPPTPPSASARCRPWTTRRRPSTTRCWTRCGGLPVGARGGAPEAEQQQRHRLEQAQRQRHRAVLEPGVRLVRQRALQQVGQLPAGGGRGAVHVLQVDGVQGAADGAPIDRGNPFDLHIPLLITADALGSRMGNSRMTALRRTALRRADGHRRPGPRGPALPPVSRRGRAPRTHSPVPASPAVVSPGVAAVCHLKRCRDGGAHLRLASPARPFGAARRSGRGRQRIGG